MEKLVPRLRFPGFEGNWEKKNLSDITTKIGDGIHGTPVYNDDGEYYFINGNNLVDGKIVYNTSPKKVDFKEFQKQNIKLDGRSILMSINGTIGSLGLYDNQKVLLGKSACYINVDELNDRLLLYFILQSDKLQRSFGGNVSGSTIKNLSLGTIRSTEILIPKIDEQRKISKFLECAEDKLLKIKKKNALLEKYKKGMMQKIFDQEVRFKDEDGGDFGEWEILALDKLGSTYGGLQGKSGDDFGSGKRYIQYKQIFDSTKIDFEGFGFVSISENESQNRVRFGDTFFTTSSETPNEVGLTSVLLDEVEELYLNSFCFGFRPNSVKLFKPEFAQYIFRSKSFRDEVIKLAQGSTRYNISKVQLMKIEIAMPKPEEQNKIANFLSAIDNKIDLVAKEIEKMESWKKGLLGEMFV